VINITLMSCLRNSWKIVRRYVILSHRIYVDLITRNIDMDVVFALAYNEGVSPVAVSLRKDVPLAGSLEADRILGFDSAIDSNSGSEKN
jgi:hypothetical protein